MKISENTKIKALITMIILGVVLAMIAVTPAPARANAPYPITCKDSSGRVVLVADGRVIRVIGWNKQYDRPEFTDTRKSQSNRHPRIPPLPADAVCFN